MSTVLTPAKPPSYLTIFQDPKNGSANQPTQKGLCALLTAGRDVWNEWRAWNPVIPADFSDVDFGFLMKPNKAIGGIPIGGWEIDLAGINWGMTVKFCRAKFPFPTPSVLNQVRFNGSTFGMLQHGGHADFSQARFEGRACFDHTAFLTTSALFDHAVFVQQISFREAYIKDAYFRHATFCDGAFFRRTEFEVRADFTGAKFNGSLFTAYFSGVQFAQVTFTDAKINGPINFGTEIPAKIIMWDRTQNAFVEKQAGTQFCVFHKAPKFFNCTLHADIQFSGGDAQFPDIESEHASRAYRALRQAMSTHQATREEQMFFRLELRSERRATKDKWRKFAYWAYEFFSDYGFSIRRPLIRLWLWPVAIALAVYAVLAFTHTGLHGPLNWTKVWQCLEYTVIQSLPLPGLDSIVGAFRDNLFGTGSPWLLLLATFFLVAQKILCLFAFFFAGLALRNLFKIR